MDRERDEVDEMQRLRNARARGGEPVDLRIAHLAEAQNGHIGRDALRGLGLGEGAVQHRLNQGRLRPVHRGVYAVGHRRNDRWALWHAAVLLGGDDAALSHRAAAAHAGLLRGWWTPVEVTVPTQRRHRPGVRFARRRLPSDERIVREGIPTTTVARTLLDLAATAPEWRFTRALREAEVQGIGETPSLVDLLARYPGHRGTARVRRALDLLPSAATFVPNELEARFLSLVASAGLPPPACRYGIALPGDWLEADFAWPGARVVVELDGRRFHDTPATFERDRTRDRKLVTAGWRVIRITWRQLHDDPAGVMGDLRRLLVAAGELRA